VVTPGDLPVLDRVSRLAENRQVAVGQLVWDMDGTLLESGVAVPASFVTTVGRLGGPAVTPEQVIATYSHGPAEAILAHLLGRELAPAEADVYYDVLAGSMIVPYPGVPGVLARLRGRGHPVAVFTGASRRAAEMLLSAAGLAVDVLVGGDQVARPKPAGDGLAAAARLLGRPSADLAYIGDSPLDLRAAKAVGGYSAAAAWGHQYDAGEPADFTLADPVEALDLLAGDGR
jgi:HAD superfamily hydrolase (TIGR01509 family)